MEKKDFKNELSLDIINQYIKAREYYNHLISVARRMIEKEDLSLEKKEDMNKYINLLRGKRDKVQAVINALKKRYSSKPIYEYTNHAKYQIIGDETASKLFLERLGSLDNMLVELNELRRDRQVARLIYDNNLYGQIRTRLVQTKIRKLKKKIGIVQNFQRECLLEKAKLIGRQKYGMITQAYEKKERRMDKFIERLKSLQALKYETQYAENFEEKNYVLNKTFKN